METRVESISCHCNLSEFLESVGGMGNISYSSVHLLLREQQQRIAIHGYEFQQEHFTETRVLNFNVYA